ncbi:hypothetical protein U2453_29640, partial [Klebsiella pneumoniae]
MASVRCMAAPSTFETKCTRRRAPLTGRSASARAKVGTTDADTDYIGHATVFQRAHQHAHALADLARGGIGLGRHRRIDHVAAQCGVQRGATFGQVDLLATEQAGDGTTDITVGSQRQQCLQRRGIVFLPGEVDVQRT